ncbi:hypothetical protein [Methylorubrum extorquens]
MDDFGRLRLLQTILAQARLETTASIRSLAYDIESLFDSIDGASQDMVDAFGELWTALEIRGWRDEEKIEILETWEIAYFQNLINIYAKYIQSELERRGKIKKSNFI